MTTEHRSLMNEPSSDNSETNVEVGVGPWPGTEEDWPTDPHYDRTLLAEGDRRNVEDQYRYWTLEAIVADLDEHRHPLHIAIENWGHDFNIGSIVRTANAFNVAGVHVVGRKRWNRRGAMVTDRYLHVHHHDTVDDLAAWASEHDLPLLGIDNLPGSVPIEHRPLPRACILLLGQEGSGLTEAAQDACEAILHITQHGSTRSINAGAAGAIAMFSWALQHAARDDGPA